MKEFGLFIKTIREQKALTLRDIESQSGISNSYLNQIENGKIKKISPDILHKIGNVYGIPYDMLLIKAGYPVPDYGIDANIINNGKPVILIIDDSANDRELIKGFLQDGRSDQYIVVEAESEAAALDAVSRTIPDCVLLDYRLRDTDGLSLFARLKEIDAMSTTPVIIMTGQGNEKIAVKAMKMGAENYITKDGINRDSIIEALQNALLKKKLKTGLFADSLFNKTDTNKKNEEWNNLIKNMALNIIINGNRLMHKEKHLREDPQLIRIMEIAAEMKQLCRDRAVVVDS